MNVSARSPFASVCRVRVGAQAEPPGPNGDLSTLPSRSERGTHCVVCFCLFFLSCLLHAEVNKSFKGLFEKHYTKIPLNLNSIPNTTVASVCRYHPNEMQGICKSDACSGQKLVGGKGMRIQWCAPRGQGGSRTEVPRSTPEPGCSEVMFPYKESLSFTLSEH